MVVKNTIAWLPIQTTEGRKKPPTLRQKKAAESNTSLSKLTKWGPRHTDFRSETLKMLAFSWQPLYELMTKQGLGKAHLCEKVGLPQKTRQKWTVTHAPVSVQETPACAQAFLGMPGRQCLNSPEAEVIRLCCTGGLVGAVTLIWESMAFLGSCHVVVWSMWLRHNKPLRETTHIGPRSPSPISQSRADGSPMQSGLVAHPPPSPLHHVVDSQFPDSIRARSEKPHLQL